MSTELETKEEVQQKNSELDLNNLADDNDLADFFSKKGKKKNKKKKKKAAEKGDALTTNESNKQESAKQEEVENTLKENETNKDDEWNDYEEEVKDYSILKVKNLEIESEEATEQVEEEKEYNASGELVESRSEEGPWNRSMSEVQEQPKVAAPKPVSKLGKYVPPSMRRGNEQGISSLGRRPQKTFKKDSFIDFPTLNAAVQDQKTANPGFQTVKKGAKQQTVTSMANQTATSTTTPWRSRRQREGDQQSSVATSNQFSAFNSNNSRGGRW